MAVYNLEKEKGEAIDAGRRAFQSLENAARDLSSARNWGIFDLFGGGFISSLVKRDKMKNAQYHMEQAKYDLRNFSKELKDVEMGCDLNIETNDFLSFADWFFDGFVVDFMVQSRITNAQNQVAEAMRRVEDILYMLETYYIE